jgi:hypothetical protein
VVEKSLKRFLNVRENNSRVELFAYECKSVRATAGLAPAANMFFPAFTSYQ